MRISDEDLTNWFTYHTPRPDQIPRYGIIRYEARKLAVLIRDSCPPSADTTSAIRKLRDAVMTANAAIACEDEPHN